MKAYLKRGVPAEKLIFGFANYGTSWTVDGDNGLGKPAHKGGNGGRCSKSQGYLSATEITDLERTRPNGYRLNWDNTAKVPYATWGNQFASFENVTSIQYKTDYIKKNNFGGGMLWVIDADTLISDYIWKELRN